MRISMDSTDPSFNLKALHVSVFLDDVLLSYCITADEELGTCLCFIHPFTIVGGEAATEVKHGKVKIIVPKD